MTLLSLFSLRGLHRAWPSAAVLAASSLGAGPTAAQDSLSDYAWQTRVSTAFDYSSGKYGEVTDTEIAFLPLTVQAAKGPWTFKASGAWMSVSGPALILDGSGSGSAGGGVNRTVNGAGDLNLSTMYSLEQLYDRGVYIDFTARVKIPTASYSKGLGTGKTDVAGQFDIAGALGDFLPFATAGYKLNGSPAGFALRDVAYGSVGVQYGWSDRVATGLAFDYRQSAVRTASDPQEGSLYMSVRLTERFSMNVYGVVGFSDNSPAAGGGIVFTYRPNLRSVPTPP